MLDKQLPWVGGQKGATTVAVDGATVFILTPIWGAVALSGVKNNFDEENVWVGVNYKKCTCMAPILSVTKDVILY